MKIIKEKNKISILLDEVEIGKITFFEADGKLVVDHTFVEPKHRGKEYARILVDEVVKYARESNIKINPVCPYVDRVLTRYEKYHDVIEITLEDCCPFN